MFSYKKLSNLFLGWCILWTALQAVALQLTFAFGWGTSLADAFITNLVVGIAGYDMILVMKYYQPRQATRIAMSIALALICVFAIHHVTLMVVNETEAYKIFMDQSILIRGMYCWLMIVFITSLTSLWMAMRDNREGDERLKTIETLAREAELSRLRQQLQPHFLFNSLNSISALAGSNPEQARKMIHQLSDFFRGTLKKDDQQMVAFEDELDHLTLYLEIEKVRFGHRLRTEIDCSNEAKSMKLPTLLLQPVVENAIKFGLYDTIGETTVRIYASEQNGALQVRIENPFDPETSQPRTGTGFGLKSIQRRLYLLFGRNDLLITSARENIFITTIKIPQIP